LIDLLSVLSDPREYMKVIRHEGKFPFGMAQLTWTLEKFFTETDVTITRGADKGFLGRGEKWKNIRTFLQTDLLSPQAASGYIPGVILAAELASKGAPYISDDVNSYLNRCTFDMFMTVMLGELTAVADSRTPTDPINLEFIDNAAKFLSLTTNLMTNLPEIMFANVFNHRTTAYTNFHMAGERVLELSRDKVRQFKEKYEAGTLNELQKQSYLANAIKRQQNQVGDSETHITEEMMIDICALLLIASVDTTSSVISFALGHLALSEEVQEKLYKELKTNMTSKETGRLTHDMIETRSVAPYLHAVLRESHRMTPSAGEIVKEVSTEIKLHGVPVPAKSRIAFNAYALQMDPEYVDDPEVFRPERWLPDAVESRKGTPKEVIDHPFFKDPFSQGARKCPGSRVAVNEILALLCQLVLDHKISTPPEDIPYTLMGAMAAKLPKLEFVPRN
jgi:cytochrome P450